MARAARDYEKLTWKNGHGAAVCIGASDAELAPENEEHLVFVVVRMPGELSLDLCHFDVLVVDLTYNSRRPKLCESGTRKFKRDGVLLQHDLLLKWGETSRGSLR